MNQISGTAAPASFHGEALRAIRANFLPGLALWLVAASVVFAYYCLPATRGAFDALARLKGESGFLFSVVSTGLFAGLIPFCVLRLMPATRAGAGWGTLAFMAGFWAYRGFEIDLFYRFQGMLFGNGNQPATIAAKVAVDLFVYNVVWAANLQLLAYQWKTGGFRLSAFSGQDWPRYFRWRLPMALVSTWVVWLPVTSLVYSLPANLQIPLFNLAACFWSLVMNTLTARKPAVQAPT